MRSATPGGNALRAKLLLPIVVAIAAKAACAGTTGEKIFAASACDYAVSFPVAPLIESLPEVAPGIISTKAQTPEDYSPWLLAQCTGMPAGSDPIDAATLESQDKAILGRMHARNITSSSTKDARGNVTTTVGDLVMGDSAMVMTKLTIVGPRSILYVTALEAAHGDRSIKERFFSHILRKPS
jgi:hypothetical protein